MEDGALCACRERWEGPTMVDRMSTMARSRLMSSVKRRDTKIEKTVRSFLHRKGFRFRVDVATLPGRPDIVLRRWEAVIFVHGCFWHRHQGCPRSRLPATNTDFWAAKLKENAQRDLRACRELTKAGWRVATIWECSMNSQYGLACLDALSDWLRSEKTTFSSDAIWKRSDDVPPPEP
mgnify:CR=1 FL=1